MSLLRFLTIVRGPRSRGALRVGLVGAALTLAACGDGAGSDTTDPTSAQPETGEAAAQDEPLTVYSGRSEELVGPVIDDLSEATGLDVEVRYGDTAELAATILEEGENSPADVFFSQDAGALGALAAQGMLSELPDEATGQVEERFAAQDSSWVGVSGRARVLAYNTEMVTEEELPASVLDLTDDAYAGQVGWAPTNGSFQAFVTAMRVELGDEATREWVEAMVANDVQVYEGNTPIVEAVGRGEVRFGLVNHYYLYQFLAEDPSFPVENGFLTQGDLGALINVAGVGVLETTDQPDEAIRFVEFLLSTQAQQYFSTETYEYPLVTGVDADDRLPALADLQTPDLDLSDLEDLQGTLELLQEAGALT